MFATHYHSLLEDWKDYGAIRLGHVECIAEEDSSDDVIDKSSIILLYTLGDGPCPKSFGVNVAMLAGLPDDVLCKAKNVSDFEAEMNGESNHHKIIPSTATSAVEAHPILKLILRLRHILLRFCIRQWD
jgi:DNA mismatch repair protein MSH6